MSESDVRNFHLDDGFPRFRRCLTGETWTCEEDTRTLTYTFSISVCAESFGGLKDHLKDTKGSGPNRKGPKFTLGTKAPQYFHIEYSPTDEDHTFSTDAVIFSNNSAKVYPSGLAPKAVFPWRNGNKIWIAWIETTVIKFTEERMDKILRTCHKGGVKFKIWDCREKCAIQTRFDRPRAFEDFARDNQQTVEAIVGNVAKFCERNILCSEDSNAAAGCTRNGDMLLPQHQDCAKKSRTMGTDGANVKTSSKQRQENQTLRRKQNKTRVSYSKILLSKSSRKKKTDPLIEALGSCCLVLNLAHCFGKQQPEMITASKPTTVTRPATTTLSGSVLLTDETFLADVVVALQLEQPLLTETQCEYYKPVVIQLSRIKGLPTQPYANYNEMHRHCEPLQMTWCIGDILHYNSHLYIQEKDIRTHDIQVVLTGLHSNQRVLELLLGTPLILDLYDRVPKREDKPQCLHDKKKTPFGCKPKDDLFGKLSTNDPVPQVANRWVKSKAYTVDRHPYGRATICLGEAVTLHQKMIQYSVPVLPLNGTDFDTTVTMRTAKEKPRKRKTDYVGYLDSNCEIIVTIDFNFDVGSLTNSSIFQEPRLSTVQRFICWMDLADGYGTANDSRNLLQRLKLFILKTNGRSLGLPEDSSCEEIKTKLKSCGTETMLFQSRRLSQDFDPEFKSKLTTGIHLSDPKFHFIILEVGNPDTANRIREQLEVMREAVGMNLLEDSSLRFSDRLYLAQDFSIPELKLCARISDLVRQSLIHVRDHVPRLTYCGMNLIYTIKKTCTSLKDVVRMGLFPTSAMVDCISEAFSTPSTPNKLMHPNVMKEISCGSENLRYITYDQNQVARTRREDFDYNKEKATTNMASTKIYPAKNAQPLRYSIFRSNDGASEVSYNYSIQKLNSAGSARRKLWRRFAQLQVRCTYSDEFLQSGSFEARNKPLDFPSLLRA
ncbi:hypothetical protein CRM22_004755 [Opisthorchis felineus]|uniref:DUF4550 domain-containing protein n=1 Tax=Opisthorchis felineus TaxID=147828 RepID=A0A4S2LUM6_OPIFE|nr:hypothetical protein CRM22_004755 [Opisthorchis felineus]